MDFVSIVIPAYNAERWLDRCLRSVMDAIDTDCEVIIVNDGSTDDTRNIATTYADDDPRVTLLNIAHVGPCAARKAGFDESQGDYIVFVDSDDVLPANAIREQRRLLNVRADDDNNPVKRPLMIIGNTVARTQTGTDLLISGQRRRLTGKQYALEILRGDIPGFLPGHFFARVLLESIDWDDNPAITHHDHHYLTLSMAMRLNDMDPDGKLVLIDAAAVCYNYMRRPGSQSALMSLTPEGLERVWFHLCNLHLPEPEFTYWGLNTIHRSFVERGVPFDNDFKMASELRQRAEKLGDDLPERYKELVSSLNSPSKRIKIARRLSRTGSLTSISPHLSVIIVCRHNISKVERTVASIFNTGLRNLEVILIDLDNSHNESIDLNRINIRYPRVRVHKVEPGTGVFAAGRLGVGFVSGLCVMFVRPGDLVNGEGIYNAVTTIDYGADVVLVNHRHFSPLTRLRSSVFSYSYLRATEQARNAERTPADRSENVYARTVEELKNINAKDEHFNIYGMIWRRSVLVGTGINNDEYADLDRPTISHKAVRNLLMHPMHVATQDRHAPHSYEFATGSLLRHAVKGRIAHFLF